MDLRNRKAVCNVYEFEARADTRHKIDDSEIPGKITCDPSKIM